MSPTAFALLGFAAWTVALVSLLGLYRSGVVMAGKKASNAFNPSGEDLEGFGRRLTRAHANCYENLPIAGAVLLYAIATQQTAVTDPLAYGFIGARVAQSLVHLVSTSRPAVLVRFLLFVTQIAILTYWLLQLFQIV
jgi:uncharacterized MAPEG superfamily protein